MIMKRMKFKDFYDTFIYKKTSSLSGKTNTIATQILFDDYNINSKSSTIYMHHMVKRKQTVGVFFENKKTGSRISIDEMNSRLRKLNLDKLPSCGKETLSKIKDYYFDPVFIKKLENEADSLTSLSLLIFDILDHYLEARDDAPSLENDINSYPVEKYSFLETINNSIDDKTDIYFAFHYGFGFFLNPRENNLLRDYLINKRAYIKVVVNTIGESTITPQIIKNLHDRDLPLIDPYTKLSAWLTLMKEIETKSFAGTLEVYVCKLPIMHKMHLFFKEEKKEVIWGAANVSYYCYGEKNIENNHVYIFENEQFGNLKDEFEYLLSISEPLEQYLNDIKNLAMF